jgi:anti-sigma-K factor RskA
MWRQWRIENRYQQQALQRSQQWQRQTGSEKRQNGIGGWRSGAPLAACSLADAAAAAMQHHEKRQPGSAVAASAKGCGSNQRQAAKISSSA